MKEKSLVKKAISIVLSFILMMSITLPSLAAEAKLKDIAGNPYEETIQKWVDSGYIKGYPDGAFKPDNPITRAEFMVLVNRAFKMVETAEPNFSDVKKTDWFYGEVSKAVKAGYMGGSNGKMYPNNNITRQELAVVVSQLGKLDTKVDDAVLNKMEDAGSIPAWSKGAISAALSINLFDDFVTTEFKATQNISRVEAVVVLDRLMTELSAPAELPTEDVAGGAAIIPGGGGNGGGGGGGGGGKKGDVIAQDFGVMNFSGVTGYTVGFGLVDAKASDVKTVVVKLYKGETLLATTTSDGVLKKYKDEASLSAPFDILGSFDYAADGCWAYSGWQVAQTDIPTKAEITVTFNNGLVKTATNTNLTGVETLKFISTNEQLSAAILAQADGQIWIINAGTYDINAGFEISKNITLIGVGEVILVADEAPVARTEVSTYRGKNPIILINNANVSIKNITVEATNMQNYTPVDGITACGSSIVRLEDVTVTDIMNMGAYNGMQYGRGYTGDTGTNTTIIHCTFSNFNKNGVHFYGANTTGSVDNSSFTGTYQTGGSAAQNGVVFQSGATGSVTNSRFESICYTNPEPTATGVLSYGIGSNATVTNNTFINIQTPISEAEGGTVTESGNTINQTVDSVSLNKATATIAIGLTETLVATVSPASATNKNVTWVSDNNAAATVNDAGVITGVGSGTANITVITADGGKTASCAVTVVLGLSDQVAYYTYTVDSFKRSYNPIVESDGTTNVSQVIKTDGSVGITVSSANTYVDSGFVMEAGTLGELGSIEVQGTGSYGLNLYFDLDGGSFFKWNEDGSFGGIGGDKYALYNEAHDTPIIINGSSQFGLQGEPAGAKYQYTLDELKEKYPANTPVGIWVGVTRGGSEPDNTMSAVINSVTVTHIDPAVANVATLDKLKKALADNTKTTINITGSFDITEKILVNRSVTINGGGNILTVSQDLGKDNSSKHALGIEADNVTINDLTVDSASMAYGVLAYAAANVTLEDLTIKNSKGAGLTVNGSTIAANNLNTSGNAWGAVNVDPGSGVTTPSIFTLTGGGVLAENTQIWSDGANVAGTAIVNVNADGYTKYAPSGSVNGFIWTNRPLQNVATITRGDTTTMYSTIQAAVNAADSGDVINVAAGTYVEQVIVDGKDLTINGATDNGTRLVTIKSPAILSALFTTSADAKPIIGVKNTNSFTITNIIVDGDGKGQPNYRFMGIGMYNSGGSIRNCEIKNMIEAAYNGMQHGTGIYAYNTDGVARTVNVTNNVIYNYNKGGIVINGANLTGNVTDNTVTGQNVRGLNAQNGIQFGFGATGTVVRNTVTNNKYNNEAGTLSDNAAGILLYQATGMKSADDIKIDNPNVTGNDIDVWIEK